eukprot:2645821-Lingulodinium_polyedra.AAC.1
MSVKPEYLQALLRAPVHKHSVKHFMPTDYYQAIIDGRTYIPKRHKGFQFMMAASADQSKMRPPASRPRRRREDGFIRPADHDDEGMHESEDDEDPSKDQGEESGSEAHQSSASSDDDSSSSSSSSISSSRSSSSMSASPAVLADERPCVTLLRDNERWKGFKFTKTWSKDKSLHIGWETTCYNPAHRLPSKLCRRTRNIGKDGEEMCQRKLKWWCLHFNVATRDEHQLVPDFPEGGLDMMPSMARLDAVPIMIRGGGEIEDYRQPGSLLD